MWDFGDNSTSTDSFPIHTYKNGGSYIVKLTANGPGGATKIEKSISVPAPPSKCTITSVVLNSYSTGIDYDAGNYPDLYIIALNKGGFLFNSRATSVYMNSAPTVSRTWSLSPPPTINQLNESIKITFWDLDEVEKGDADDLMEAFVFTPFDYIGEANPYPSKIQLTGNKVTCSLNVSWN